MIKRLRENKTLRSALRKNLYLLFLMCSVSAFSQPSRIQHSAPDTSEIKVDSIEVASEEIHSVKADTLPGKSPQRSEETNDTTGTIDPFYQSLQKKAEKNKLLQLLYNLIVVFPSTAPSAADTVDFIKKSYGGKGPVQNRNVIFLIKRRQPGLHHIGSLYVLSQVDHHQKRNAVLPNAVDGI